MITDAASYRHRCQIYAPTRNFMWALILIWCPGILNHQIGCDRIGIGFAYHGSLVNPRIGTPRWFLPLGSLWAFNSWVYHWKFLLMLPSHMHNRFRLHPNYFPMKQFMTIPTIDHHWLQSAVKPIRLLTKSPNCVGHRPFSSSLSGDDLLVRQTHETTFTSFLLVIPSVNQAWPWKVLQQHFGKIPRDVWLVQEQWPSRVARPGAGRISTLVSFSSLIMGNMVI